MHTTKISPITTGTARSKLSENKPNKKETKLLELEAKLSRVQESMARAITTVRTMPAANVSDGNTERNNFKAKQTPRAPRAGPGPKSTPASKGFINDNALQETIIDGSSVHNFRGVDFRSEGVVAINTAAYKGAVITNSHVSNFSGSRF